MRTAVFTHSSIRFLVSALFVLIAGFKVGAAVETFNTRASGSQIVNDFNLYVADDKYDYMRTHLSWPSVFTNHKISNKVILGIDPYGQNFMNKNFTATISVEITFDRWDDASNGFIQEVQQKELEIQYTMSGPYKDKNTILINGGGQRMKVRVVSFSTAPASLGFTPNIFLEAEIEVERFYLLNTGFVMPSFSLSHNAVVANSRNELLITWNVVRGAEEYDLEWAYVNNFDGDGNQKNASDMNIDPNIFRFNSTRVTTANTYYNIPLTFEPGFILYRVRPVGRDPESDFTQLLPGSWSKEPANCTSLNMSTCMFPHIYKYGGFSTDINWQSSLDLIEDGKNKLNIMYYDATLRDRQHITRLNSENKVLVGETIYDHKGRPAIQVLPVPENKQTVTYSDDFNRNSQGAPYSKKDFEQNNENCIPASPMETQVRNGKTGASNYYSPANQDQADQQAFLPDAKGYPFVHAQYTLDNTGRVRAKSGVGADHKIGSGHETKFYYGQPFQEELDRLFGLDVGLDKNYRKNISVDPNGQVTVVYLDAQNKTIATALTGSTPQTLEPLPGNADRSLTIDLLSKINPSDPSGTLDMLSPDGRSKTLNRNYIATAQGSRDFHYDINTGTFVDQCSTGTQKCYNCVVNVTMSVKNECGEEVFPAIENNNAHTKKVGTISPGCTDPTGTFTTDANDLSMNIGNYQISKIISIDQQALDVYTADFLDPQKNPCLIPFTTFLGEELNKVDTSGCEMDCEQCQNKIGIFPSWDLNDYNLFHNPNCNPCLEKEEYDKLIATCDRLCKNEAVNCERGLNGMLADVSPFGQYGGVISLTTPLISTQGILDSTLTNSTPNSGFDPSKHPLSVFNTSNQLPINYGAPNWKNPKHYLNVNALHYFTDATHIAYVNVLVLSPADGSTNPRFLPELENGAVSFDTIKVGSVISVEPQKLKNVEDFIALWQPYWAQSLVKYHPEFCYYEICVATQTSHDFDARWLSVAKVNEAMTQFNFSGDLSGLPNPLADTSLNAMDPYFNRNLSVNPRYQYWEYKLMQYRMKFYKFDPTVGFISIWKAAHIAANCPNYARSATSCPNCLDNFDGINTDEEWIQFRSLYLSLKQNLQDYKTRLETINKGCYNGCIGVDNFDPSTLNIYDPTIDNYNYSQYLFSPYYSFFQTCYFGRKDLFKQKAKRFPTASDMTDLKKENKSCYQELPIPIDKNGVITNLKFPAVDELNICAADDSATIKKLEQKADRILFETCGQCPLARDIQFLIDAVAREDRDDNNILTKKSQLALDNTDIDPSIDAVNPSFKLSCFPFESKYKEFTPDLEKALNLPGSGIIVWKQLTLTDKRLDAAIQRQTGTEKCNLTLILPDTSSYKINDIKGICCVHYETTPNLLPLQTGHNFRLHGIVNTTAANGVNVLQKIPMEGVSCVDISTCPMPPACTITAQGDALESLFDALISQSTISSNKFTTNGTAIDIFSSTVGQFEPYSSLIRNVLNKPELGALTASNWVWTSTESGNQLTGFIKDKNSPDAIMFEFFLPPDADFGFKDIISVENIAADLDNSAPENNFEFSALVLKPGGTKSSVKLKGFSSVYKISSCIAVSTAGNN